jgi:nicotinamidase-related amidase
MMKKQSEAEGVKGKQEKTALLVIDVQKALFDRSTPIFQSGQLIQNINELVAKAHRAHVPVIYVQHANTSFLAEGSEGWELHPQLKPLRSDLQIVKHHGNAFQETCLADELKARGITTVVATGLVTHGCVKETCLGANQLGYRVILVKDGHSSYHKKAAQLIEEWNQKLSDGVVELKSTQDVDFGSASHS